MAAFVRAEPLESEMVEGIEAGIRSVPGVTDVWHEDRGQWVAEGEPDRELVEAVAAFLDGISDRARPYL